MCVCVWCMVCGVCVCVCVCVDQAALSLTGLLYLPLNAKGKHAMVPALNYFLLSSHTTINTHFHCLLPIC